MACALRPFRQEMVSSPAGMGSRNPVVEQSSQPFPPPPLRLHDLDGYLPTVLQHRAMHLCRGCQAGKAVPIRTPAARAPKPPLLVTSRVMTLLWMGPAKSKAYGLEERA